MLSLRVSIWQDSQSICTLKKAVHSNSPVCSGDTYDKYTNGNNELDSPQKTKKLEPQSAYVFPGKIIDLVLVRDIAAGAGNRCGFGLEASSRGDHEAVY